MTELLRPFRDSLTHFKKSCEGETGSSILEVAGVVFPATDPASGRVEVVPFGRPEVGDPDVFSVEDDGGLVGVIIAETFPLGPTVVQAPPVEAEDAGCARRVASINYLGLR